MHMAQLKKKDAYGLRVVVGKIEGGLWRSLNRSKMAIVLDLWAFNFFFL